MRMKYFKKFVKEFFKALSDTLKVLAIWAMAIGTLVGLIFAAKGLASLIGDIPAIIVIVIICVLGLALTVATHATVQDMREEKGAL